LAADECAASLRRDRVAQRSRCAITGSASFSRLYAVEPGRRSEATEYLAAL
jgi:hypothetical protein